MPIPNKESLQHRIQNHLAYKLGSLMIAYDKARQKNLKNHTSINTSTNATMNTNTNTNTTANTNIHTNTNINTNVNAKFNTNPSTTTPTQVALNSAGGGGIIRFVA